MSNVSSMEDFLQKRQAEDQLWQEKMSGLICDLDESIRVIDESASGLSVVILSLLLEMDRTAPDDDVLSIEYRPIRDSRGIITGLRIINIDLQEAVAEAFCRAERSGQAQDTELDIDVVRQTDAGLPPGQVWMFVRKKAGLEGYDVRAQMELPVDDQEAPRVIQLDFLG